MQQKDPVAGWQSPTGFIPYPGFVDMDFEAWCQKARENGGFVPANLVGFSTSQFIDDQRARYERKVTEAGGNPYPIPSHVTQSQRLPTLDGLQRRGAQALVNQAEERAQREASRCGQVVGLGTFLQSSGGERKFTRAEVLAVLRAINACDGRFHEAILAFERME